MIFFSTPSRGRQVLTPLGVEQTTSLLVVLIVAFSMRKPPVLPGVNKKALANKTSEKWKQDIGGDIKEDV